MQRATKCLKIPRCTVSESLLRHSSGRICFARANYRRAFYRADGGHSARSTRSCSHQEHALARALPVEQAVGFLGLVECPAMGEEAVDIDLARRDEVGAFGLADAREGPGRDDGELLPQQVGADVERDVAALADEAYRAPHLGALDGGEAAGFDAGSVEGEVGAAAREILDRAHGIVGAGVHDRVGAEFRGATEPFAARVDGDDARAHGGGELRRREADWALAEDGDGVVAGELHAAQRAIGRAGAAGDRRAGREAERVGERHQREGGHFEPGRVAAMRVVAVDRDRLLLAELRPAGAAMVARGAAAVVMHHDACAETRLLLRHAGADGGDDAAGLVPGDDRVGVDREPADGGAALGAAILVEIAAAHARGLHLHDDLARIGRGVGKWHELDLSFAEEDDAAHDGLPIAVLEGGHSTTARRGGVGAGTGMAFERPVPRWLAPWALHPCRAAPIYAMPTMAICRRVAVHSLRRF